MPLDKLSGEKVVQIFFPSEMDIDTYFVPKIDQTGLQVLKEVELLQCKFNVDI